MAVCLKIYIDHTLSIKQLYNTTKSIYKHNKLSELLNLLGIHEISIGSFPVDGYNKWEKDFADFEEFTRLIKENSATIRNNVFAIHIARKGIIINHWTKLAYFCDDKKLQDIFLKIIILISNLFKSTTAIIAADSAYKTELIAYKLHECESIDTILNWIKTEKIRPAVSISDIKRATKGRYYETDACYIIKL